MTRPNNNNSLSDNASLSATNFDLPSLHLLLAEIDVALKDAEIHLSEFNDDEEQAPLLLDSVDVLTQLAAILNLISLDGGSDLAAAIAQCLQQLYDNGDNTDDNLIMDISEGIMTLDRYIEFVLLKETLEPSLLVPIINKLNAHIGQDSISKDNFTKSKNKSNSISIANPQQNYQPLSELNLDIDLLNRAYRAGLNVLLTHSNAALSDEQTRKLDAMRHACEMAAAETGKLFWQAAAAAVTNIAEVMPLRNAQKRILIFIEQQFHNHIPVADKRFADLVSFACQRDHQLARELKSQYADNQLDAEQYRQMQRFLFGPNGEVTRTLNDLIQAQINTIKEKVDAFARGDSINPTANDAQQIAMDLSTLGSALLLLGLDDASIALKSEADAVAQWQTASPEDFDQLLGALMVAENASIQMEKTHTPGAINLPLHNRHISLHQLDTAYDALIQESRVSIANIEQSISDYMADASHDVINLQNIPDMTRQVAGAVRFLKMNDAAKMLTRLTTYIQEQILDNIHSHSDSTTLITDAVLSGIADVIMAVDYHLEGFENNHPVGKNAMNIGHQNLNKLLAA